MVSGMKGEWKPPQCWGGAVESSPEPETGTALLSQGPQWHCCCPCPLPRIPEGFAQTPAKVTRGQSQGCSRLEFPSTAATPAWTQLYQWWQPKWGLRLREPSVWNPPGCLKAEAGLKKKKKGFLYPLKAELKLWGGLVSSEAGAGTGWNQHRESWLFSVPAALLFPLPATGNDNFVKHRTFGLLSGF